MDRRQFLATAAAAPLARAASKPNVVIFLVDDMGYGDIGPYGVQDTKTPHLDKLAREGVRFTDSYSNGPVCTPTRCALMTGRYQQRYGLEWATLPTQREFGLATTNMTLPRMLKNQGYRTAMFGKWHLGGTPELMPVAHGFDEFFGITGGNVDHYTHRNVSGRHDLYDGVELVEKKGAFLTDLLTQRAVGFLDRHAREHASEPFFLYVPYNSVHWPFQRPDRPDERNKETWYDGSREDYVKMVENIDESVGAVLQALDRNKFAENTLVIFTNDNGGERYSRNDPFFHHKGTLWEGGLRVPTILRWPGRTPAGVGSAQPMITMDITATVAAASGAQPKEPLEGIDLLPVIRRKQPVERTFYWRINRNDRKQQSVRRGNLKYIKDGAIEMLFDLAADPGERHDLAVYWPKQVAEMRAMYAAWESDLAKTPPPFVVQ